MLAPSFRAMPMRIFAVLFALFFATQAGAVELRVLTAGAMQEVEREAAAEFTRATGHTLVITPGTVGQIQQRLNAGEAADIVVLSAPALAMLRQAGGLKRGSDIVLARIGIGVGARAGAPRPDISTPDAFRAAMLAARSVVHMDPATGASSGIATAKIFESLGIAAAMEPKTILQTEGYTADRVASGEAELAIQNMSEIIPVKGAVLVGPLPPALQTYTTYAAGIGARSAQPDAAKAFLDHLARAETQAHWDAAGIEPIRP
jgi:molybdate transport system substrate-binding protein